MKLLNEIEIISFDVDGTLIKKGFNDLIWRKEIPSLYAKKEGISFVEAEKEIAKKYDEVGEKNICWYDINFWIRYLNLEIKWEDMVSKYEAEIKLYPDVLPTLKRLKKRFSLIVITGMPVELLTPKLKKIGNYFLHSFSTVSDFKNVKIPSVYLKICQKLKISPEKILHIGDHWEFDYLYPGEIGIKAIFIDRENKKKGEWIIKDLGELESLLNKEM
jgi:putative hydrolase of the HAD superfamily